MTDKDICPTALQLIKEDETYSTKIVDVELDIIDCEFVCDDIVELNTQDYTYITLSRQNLLDLLKLMDEIK